ncbi:uncharacterized protein LOC131644704 [Vicia villosa]|uniref:uncharacterized protein LOC131644704 n=1 Tax=Vicia villosa TaxID=3911 RepID=UPI00273CAE79|nr:uncharacterized protein LOC131644704 [Vicia villosa]
MLRSKWEPGTTIWQNLHTMPNRVGSASEGIQKCIQTGTSHRGLVALEFRLQSELDGILQKEEFMWHQRSRAKWLRDGDRNTRYYHIKAVTRRRLNNVLMLQTDNGEWIDDAGFLNNMATMFYKNLFSLDQSPDTRIDTRVNFPMLGPDVVDRLNFPIEDDEDRKVVFNMHLWKALGPDGLPTDFYQKSWDIVKVNVCGFVKNVWRNPSLLKEVNQTDICLIPKVSHPKLISQFRPISLCNFIYKVVTKVIVDRLKDCMLLLISPYQTGFVPGQNKHKNIIIAQEMIHTMMKVKGHNSYFVVKVDLSKARDKLNWNFIEQVLVEVGISGRMLNVILHAISTVETNVKWNGAGGEFFCPQRGIRQGDLISPYLFVLCMDKLSHLISQEVNEGRWKTVRAGRNGQVISHLMFADDLLLFGEVIEPQIRCIMRTLEVFCKASGQQMSNEETSILFSPNSSRRSKEDILRISGFRETTALGKYLGVPFTGKAPRRKDVEFVNDQVKAKLAKWKAKQLSLAGRITLAKSVLEAIPIYPMMTSIIPKTSVEEIHKIQRQFIWGDTEIRRKYHAVGWEMITQPKSLGGLGLLRLHVINKACILKLVSRLHSTSQDLWCQVLRGKYQQDNGSNHMDVRPTDSHLWRSVRLAEISADIPANCKNAKLVDVALDGNWNWSMLQWLLAEVLGIIGAILPPHDNYGVDERVGWETDPKQASVANMYHRLCYFLQQGEDTNWKRIWTLKVPERVRMWSSIVSNTKRSSFFTCNLTSWINTNLCNKRNCGWPKDWDKLWANACHMLWMWRNKEKFNEGFVRPHNRVERLRRVIGCYAASDGIMRDCCMGREITKQIHFVPPRTGWICINIDEACINGIISCDGVIRGDVGEWIGGFLKFIRRGDPYLDELWGLYEGMQLARSMHFSKVELRVDSLVVAQDVKERRNIRRGRNNLMPQIMTMWDLDWELEIVHVHREANQLADALAKHSFPRRKSIAFLRIVLLILSIFVEPMRTALVFLELSVCSFFLPGV